MLPLANHFPAQIAATLFGTKIAKLSPAENPSAELSSALPIETADANTAPPTYKFNGSPNPVTAAAGSLFSVTI